MKILLVGEFSNVHWTLAQGLRDLGHDVTVVSDGDGWKNYHRDIDLCRKSLATMDSIRYFIDTIRYLPKMRGYDVVQLINPIFLNLRANKILPFYRFLRKNNKKVFMGAFGMDHYWVKTCLDCKTFRYSDFNLGNKVRIENYNQEFVRDWLDGEKTAINQIIANDCDGIISGLYEYDCCYRPYFPNKTHFIPFPINVNEIIPKIDDGHEKIRFFIGMQKKRSDYKGTDIMLEALNKLQSNYPTRCEIVKVESVPYEQYQNLMNTSDVLLDQLYSYTPAMNALLAMAKGLIVVGGGEPENYQIINEQDLHPIINVLPNQESCYHEMERLMLHPELVSELSRQSVEYIHRHHDYVKVAKEYIDLYNQ